MDGDDARVRDLRQELHQLDAEMQGSALTPGEARKNQDQRRAVLDELAKLGAAAAPQDGAAGR